MKEFVGPLHPVHVAMREYEVAMTPALDMLVKAYARRGKPDYSAGVWKALAQYDRVHLPAWAKLTATVEATDGKPWRFA